MGAKQPRSRKHDVKKSMEQGAEEFYLRSILLQLLKLSHCSYIALLKVKHILSSLASTVHNLTIITDKQGHETFMKRTIIGKH